MLSPRLVLQRRTVSVDQLDRWLRRRNLMIWRIRLMVLCRLMLSKLIFVLDLSDEQTKSKQNCFGRWLKIKPLV